MGTSALAFPSTARSSASNNHAHSPLRRDPRPSTGRAPLGSSSHKLGFIGSALARPACSKQHASVRVLRPRLRERPASQVHRPRTGPGLQHLRSLTAAPGSTVLNRPAPAREFKLQARVYRCHPGPARLLKVTLSALVLRPRSRGRPVSQVHRPSTGSACNHCSPLRRVLRSSTGRPRSEARVASSGSSGPLWDRPACSSDSAS